MSNDAVYTVIGGSVDESARLYRGAYVRKSSIGERVTVGDDSQVIESTVESHCEIDRRNYIHHSRIGSFSYTGFNTYIGYADIGRYSSISRFVDIGGFDHDYTCASTLPEYKLLQLLGQRAVHEDVAHMQIGSDVWMGTGAKICRRNGVTIGNGAVIAAGAVVVTDVPAYAVFGGVPAKLIKYRIPEELLEGMLKIAWWEWPADVVARHFGLLKTKITKDVLEQLTRIDERARGEGYRE